MSSFDDAVKAVSDSFGTKQNTIEWKSAMTGDGHGVVDAGNGMVYVRLGTNSSVIQVINGGISLSDGVLCRIEKPAHDPLHWYAVRATDQRIDENGNSGGSSGLNVGPHHLTHQYLGVDQVDVDWRQITTLRVYVSSAFTIGVLAGLLPRPGADLVVPTQTLDLSSPSHIPASGALYVLISVNSAGALVVTDGATVTGLFDLTLGDIPDTPAGNFRLAAVRMYAGQSSLSESISSNDIRDLRWPQEKLASSIGIGDISLAYDSVIAGNSSGAASALSVAEQTVIGRITGGHVAALSVAQIRTLIGAGTGGGLDADLLDGQHGAYYAVAGAAPAAHVIDGSAHTITGAQYTLVGVPTTANVLGLLTPSYDVSAGASAILMSNAGALALARLTTPVNTTNSSAAIGAFEIQSYSVNNGWMGDNAYFNGGGFVYRATGFAGLLYFGSGDISFFTAASGSAGATASLVRRFKIMNSGQVGIGTDMTAASPLKLNVNGSQLFVGADSTQESPMLQIVPSYVVNTHASYTTRSIFSQWAIGGAQEVMRFESGAAPMWGVLGHAAAAQQTGAAATAGALYTATEQAMLQVAYDCLRAFGFMA